MTLETRILLRIFEFTLPDMLCKWRSGRFSISSPVAPAFSISSCMVKYISKISRLFVNVFKGYELNIENATAKKIVKKEFIRKRYMFLELMDFARTKDALSQS